MYRSDPYPKRQSYKKETRIGPIRNRIVSQIPNRTFGLITKDEQIHFVKALTIEDFYEMELKSVPGYKQIYYESLMKFGVFHMLNKDVTDDIDFFDLNPVKSLSNVWRHGGVISLQIEGGETVIFEIKKSGSYTRLNDYDTRQMVKGDYFLNLRTREPVN